MSDLEPAKVKAAEAAAALVRSGMAVGLGSGTTATLMVAALGRRVASEGLAIVGVATSVTTSRLAQSVGIPLRDLDVLDALDLNLDGADEIDPHFAMIKGRGGALLREKIVASAARRRVTIITAEKRVERLATRMPVPVEVSLFGLRHAFRHLHDLGATVSRRAGQDGCPFVTDGGNAILDCLVPPIDDPADLDRRLRAVAGVFETGLFIGLCDLLVVGHPDRVEMVEAASRTTEAPRTAG